MTTTTPKERPIIFSAEDVRAILSGAKTQFRKPCQGLGVFLDLEMTMRPPTLEGGEWIWPEGTTLRSPYRVGDRLWVKETWCPRSGGMLAMDRICKPRYRANGSRRSARG